MGSFGKFDVYSRSISPKEDLKVPKKEPYKKIPGEFSFVYGPATGGLMESVGVKIETPGELIRNSLVYTDFKKRKIRIKGLSIPDALLMVERINGFHSASHAISFLSAVEDAAGLKADEEVENARIWMIELERIRSNLEVLKRLCEPAGFGVPVNQLGYLREEISRIISNSSGHRFFFGVNGVNKADIDLNGITENITEVKKQFKRIFESLQESRIFLNRLQNNGVTKGSDLIGPAARAAGLRYDARIDSNTLPYSEMGFDPIIREEKDSFGRFMVRAEEIIQSAEILESLGIHKTPNKREKEIYESGQGAARVESPQGDLFYNVVIEKGVVEDLWFVSPSLLNIRAFENSMTGNIFTDFHFNWESFGIWISEAGVDII